MKSVLVVLVLFVIVKSAWGVTLEWDAPAEGVVRNYNMYRVVVPGGVCSTEVQENFELIGSTFVQERAFVDNGAVIGANYYHVTASNEEGESLPSNQVCFQRLQKPSAPQNLRIR